MTETVKSRIVDFLVARGGCVRTRDLRRAFHADRIKGLYEMAYCALLSERLILQMGKGTKNSPIMTILTP